MNGQVEQSHPPSGIGDGGTTGLGKRVTNAIRGMKVSRASLTIAIAMAMTVIAGLSAAAHAEWPVRPLRFIVTFAAGSGPDIICRVLTERLARARPTVCGRPITGSMLSEPIKRAAGTFYTPTLFSRGTRMLVRLLGLLG